jgi:hypothetical protein
MNPQKLFNYIIQHTETFNNVAILKEMFYLLNGCRSKLILYVYDAFVIDTAKEDKERIKAILDIFNSRELPYKVKKGSSYERIK